MTITYAIAMAAGRDAADRSMRAAGRTSWSEADYAVCCELVAKLLGQASMSPAEALQAQSRAGGAAVGVLRALMKLGYVPDQHLKQAGEIIGAFDAASDAAQTAKAAKEHA